MKFINIIKNLKNKFNDFANNKQNKFVNINKDPVFIIGTNRSGASLLSSLIRQHFEISGLTSDKKKIEKTQKIKGHLPGYGEDFIWESLDDKTSDHNNFQNEGFLWSHPRYLSQFYKEDYKYANSLINEIFKKKTDKLILVKHPFFTLRLKLIKKIFPNAKIILNIRSYKDFITSNTHKLMQGRYKKSFNKSLPDLGLHWLILNNIAIYELNKYFKKNHFIFYHEKLYDKNYDNQKLMDEVTNFLGLKSFKFNFEDVNLKYKFSQIINFDYEKIPMLSQEIADFENDFFSTKIKDE